MEIVETWENEVGGISTLYRDSNDNTELNKMFLDTYARLDAVRYDYLKNKAVVDEKSKYYWICVNPNTATVPLKMFMDKMEKMMSKKWITNYLYVFEQRGEDEGEAGKGYHFHAIIEKPHNKGYTHIFREISNSVNAVCDSSNFNFFVFQAISEEEKNRKIPYCIGRKADPSKWLKQDMDVVWRKKVGIKSHYNIGII
jgi:hypothetical protein